jgi:tetratricopeptide (TPR) repeat protein
VVKNYSEAIVCYEQALIYKPIFIEALFNLANAYAAIKKREKAINTYHRLLEVNPGHAEAERRLSLMIDAKDDPLPLARVRESLLLKSHDLLSQAQLNFAIAKYKEDLGDISAFESYQIGNKIMKSLSLWHPPDLKQLIEANEAIGCLSSTWRDPNQPIFLVGIPCCGAELIQTILAQNPLLGSMWKADFLQIASNFILDSNINSLADDKIAPIKSMHRDQDVAMPIEEQALFGFEYCSAIGKIFPGAKILHCYQDPINNLVAIYKSFLGCERPWAYDLDDIIDYYDFYLQIMAYHQGAGQTVLINVDIDAMRTNPYIEIRKLIAACGFEWSDTYLGKDVLDNCLHERVSCYSEALFADLIANKMRDKAIKSESHGK